MNALQKKNNVLFMALTLQNQFRKAVGAPGDGSEKKLKCAERIRALTADVKQK